jgi:hypothetical protein
LTGASADHYCSGAAPPPPVVVRLAGARAPSLRSAMTAILREGSAKGSIATATGAGSSVTP